MPDSTDLATTPIQVEATIVRPSLILETDDADTVDMKIMALQVFKERSKAIIDEITESIRLRLEEIGPRVIGETIFYSGHPKKDAKCDDPIALADAIFLKCGGDWNEFVKHLRADPFKVSECKITLGEAENEKFWKRETDDKLETTEFTPRKLLNANKKFMEMAQLKRQSLAKHDAKMIGE